MTREELSQLALEESERYKSIVCQLSTGVGKTKLSIDIVNHRMKTLHPKVLILVAQSVHKKNWREELTKWSARFEPIIECYQSITKYAGQEFDFLISDESQHLSERRREVLNTIKVKTNFIALSATLPKTVIDYLKWTWSAKFISLRTSEAIESNILPDPTIYKMPLKFNSYKEDIIVVNPAKKGTVKPIRTIPYSKQIYWNCKNNKGYEWHLQCTAKEYYDNLTGLIEWYKKKHREVQMLRASSQRLNWLAHKKNSIVKALLEHLKDQRTITFCTDIAQTEIVGKNCIHSKSKNSQTLLDDFNSQKIDHITACHMIDEGLNLTNCRIGIFANLNASDIIATQRIGRALRHRKPIIIIPYFIGTRDEELVNKHLEGYNTNLIKTIYNIKDIEL